MLFSLNVKQNSSLKSFESLFVEKLLVANLVSKVNIKLSGFLFHLKSVSVVCIFPEIYSLHLGYRIY